MQYVGVVCAQRQSAAKTVFRLRIVIQPHVNQTTQVESICVRRICGQRLLDLIQSHRCLPQFEIVGSQLQPNARAAPRLWLIGRCYQTGIGVADSRRRSVVCTPLLIKKIQKGVVNIKAKDSAWGNIFMTSLFMGMISAFSGMVFSRVTEGIPGLFPVAVLAVSALVMIICGLLVKKAGWKWLENYALPFSMLISMTFSVIAAPLFT